MRRKSAESRRESNCLSLYEEEQRSDVTEIRRRPTGVNLFGALALLSHFYLSIRTNCSPLRA